MGFSFYIVYVFFWLVSFMGDGLGLKEFRARIRVSLSLVVILGSRIILFMELLLVFRDLL